MSSKTINSQYKEIIYYSNYLITDRPQNEGKS